MQVAAGTNRPVAGRRRRGWRRARGHAHVVDGDLRARTGRAGGAVVVVEPDARSGSVVKS